MSLLKGPFDESDTNVLHNTTDLFLQMQPRGCFSHGLIWWKWHQHSQTLIIYKFVFVVDATSVIHPRVWLCCDRRRVAYRLLYVHFYGSDKLLIFLLISISEFLQRCIGIKYLLFFVFWCIFVNELKPKEQYIDQK